MCAMCVRMWIMCAGRFGVGGQNERMPANSFVAASEAIFRPVKRLRKQCVCVCGLRSKPKV